MKKFKYIIFACECLIIAVLSIILTEQLIFEPLIGLANSGDFYRTAPQCGVYFINGDREDWDDPNAFAYINRTFRTDKPRDTQGFRSSAILLMHASRQINDLARDDALFDIRFLGFTYIIAAIIASLIFTFYFRRLSVIHRIIGIFLTVFLLTDVGYFSYFNSFYSEPASLIFLLFTLGMAMRLSEPHLCKRAYLFRNLFFLVSAILFLTAKPQNAILVPFFCLLWWILNSEQYVKIRRRTVYTGVSITLILCAVSFYYLIIRPYKEINLYNNVFYYILKEKPGNPPDIMGELGLDEKYAALVGTHWWSIPSDRYELRDRFTREMTYARILRFYLKNPSSFVGLLKTGSEKAFRFRPHYLGNFERSSGAKPMKLSEKFSHLSRIKKRFYPKSVGSLLLMFFSLTLISLLSLYSDSEKVLPGTALCTMTMGGVQFVAVLLGEGNFELIKHLFLFNALIDISILLSVLMLCSLFKPLIIHGKTCYSKFLS